MNDSWIAIADGFVLKSLLLEEAHTVRFALRRAERENAACLWVVLQRQHAGFIQQQLALGARADALMWLDRLALDIGRVIQPELADPVWMVDCVTSFEQHAKE
ncbi:hypothetical protein [Novipirellula artificiosorum]|uniref:Uncharacterized protein n=1 Tax=Novipirellula artificiosorum TaxID=2528016 RepID=A0A5C6DFA5_9BACT|nr:hypothetical protein [Novipirellula artificiosorum]TWU34915.1 hypothetical protein Poly41_40580 [Novipirellula artificiosorum]